MYCLKSILIIEIYINTFMLLDEDFISIVNLKLHPSLLTPYSTVMKGCSFPPILAYIMYLGLAGIVPKISEWYTHLSINMVIVNGFLKSARNLKARCLT